jgi:hypothetical protein
MRDIETYLRPALLHQRENTHAATCWQFWPLLAAAAKFFHNLYIDPRFNTDKIVYLPDLQSR